MRWTPKRKRALVDLLDALTHADEHQAASALLVEHNISEEELAMWRNYLAQGGASVGHWALRVTTVQEYRDTNGQPDAKRRGPGRPIGARNRKGL